METTLTSSNSQMRALIFISLVFAGALVLCITYLAKVQNPLKVPQSKLLQLLVVKGRYAESSFICPDALDYTLLLGMPKGMTNSPAGTIYLNQDGTNLMTVELNSASLKSCNWLEQKGLTGLIIEPQIRFEGKTLPLPLHGGSNYTLSVRNTTLTGASIWLEYAYPSRWDFRVVGKQHTNGSVRQLDGQQR